MSSPLQSKIVLENVECVYLSKELKKQWRGEGMKSGGGVEPNQNPTV